MRWASVLLALVVTWPVAPAAGQPRPDLPPAGPRPTAVTDLQAADTRFDGGSSITLRWRGGVGAARFRIERAGPGEDFDSLDVAAAGSGAYEDTEATDGVDYRYRVVSIGALGEEAASAETGPVRSRPQWFNGHYTSVAIALLVFGGLILWFIRKARKGIHLFIRKIAGLEAVDEAIGRATEMGRPLLYIPGTGYIEYISTVASLNLLGEVGKKIAEYGTQIHVPVRDPIVFTVAREVVRGSYAAAGRPDAYDPESVHFLVENALAYAGAVSGIIVRERPAANFFMGFFGGESLILSETGATTGAIQIAGTDQTTQLPFFIVACDYTLIGEELYAASAYIAREPLMLGALKGQDYTKFILVALLVVGTLVSLITGFYFRQVLETSGH